MKIKYHPKFINHYKKRVLKNQKLATQTKTRISLFKINRQNPLLKDHGLIGEKKKFRAFSVTGDIRIIYFPISDKEVVFLDIGNHNQVY